MKVILLSAACGIGLFLFAGCSTAHFRNVDRNLPHAVTRGSGQFSRSGSVDIVKIDGVMVPRPADAKRVSPGPHRLQINASIPGWYALWDVDVDFKANRFYRFRASWDGAGFIVTLLDATDAKAEVPLKTTRLTEVVELPQRPIVMPIFVN